MTSCGERELVVGLGLENARLRGALTRALAAAGCRVEAFASRDACVGRASSADVRYALLIADARWLPDRSFGDLAAAGAPVLAIETGDDAPRCERPVATARIRLAGDRSDEARVARLARHLVEQDRRWGGRWISTGLLQLAAVPDAPASEPPDRPKRVPSSG